MKMPIHGGKFSLGAIEIMVGAQQALEEAGQPAAAYLYRHQYETPNELIRVDSVVSRFELPTGVILYVITDEARMHTVLMTRADAESASA
jgi:hypothetical protein